MITAFTRPQTSGLGQYNFHTGLRRPYPGAGAPPGGSNQNTTTVWTTRTNFPAPYPNLLHSLPGSGAHRGEPWKPCHLHQEPIARGAVRFWCSLPTADTSSFVPLELLVTAASSSTPRYRRIIHINEVGKCAGNGGGVKGGGLGLHLSDQPHSAVLLDAPAGLLARQAEEGGHVVLRWLPPPGAPMTAHIRYEVDVSAGNGAGGSQRVRPAGTAQPQQLRS